MLRRWPAAACRNRIVVGIVGAKVRFVFVIFQRGSQAVTEVALVDAAFILLGVDDDRLVVMAGAHDAPWLQGAGAVPVGQHILGAGIDAIITVKARFQSVPSSSAWITKPQRARRWPSALRRATFRM